MLILLSNIYYEQKSLCFQTSSKHKKVVYKINVYLYECCCLCVDPELAQNLLDRFYTKLYCLCSVRKDTRVDTVFCYTQNQTPLRQQSSFLQKFGFHIWAIFCHQEANKPNLRTICKPPETLCLWVIFVSLFPFLVVKYVGRGVLLEI